MSPFKIGQRVEFKSGQGWAEGIVTTYWPEWPKFPGGRYEIAGPGALVYRTPANMRRKPELMEGAMR